MLDSEYNGDFSALSDATLVEYAQAGSSDAFSILYGRYCESIKSYIKCLLVNDQVEADDLTQETFKKAWKDLKNRQSSLETSGIWHAEPWLKRIAKNTVYEYRRKRYGLGYGQQYKPIRLEPLPLEDNEVYNTTKPLISPGLEDEIILDIILQQALNQLSPQEKQCYLMQVVDDLRQSEIAERLHISASAVAAYVSNAKKKLRQILGPELLRQPVVIMKEEEN